MSLIDPSQAFGPNTEPMLSFLEDEALPIGTVLGGCQIMEPISIDGMSILYLATDSALQRDVLIREHFPAKWMRRENEIQVVLREGADDLVRAQALEAFLKEGRLLGKLDHPSIVKVHRFWEQNQTAYMMMPFYQGETLAALLQRITIPITETWLRQLLSALLGALQALHTAGCYHLAITPDNIWITPEGVPILLNLSESNVVIGERLHASDSLDRSYSPIEQFSHGASLRLGPWSDFYALAAVIHQAIMGHPPTPAAILGFDDHLVPLAEALLDRNPRESKLDYSLAFLAAIDQALSVLPEHRPQTAVEFEASLVGSAPAASGASAERLPEQTGPDGFSDTPRADPAAEAAIAMAISSLPWIAQKEPPKEPLFDPSNIPTEPVFVRPQSTQKLTQPQPQYVEPASALPVRSAAPAPAPAPAPRAVPIAVAARQVEPVFKPTVAPASTFEEQWIQPPLGGGKSVRSATLQPPQSSKKGLWAGVWLAVFSAIGLGIYVSQSADVSNGANVQAGQAKIPVSVPSASLPTPTRPVTLDRSDPSTSATSASIPALPSALVTASAPVSVQPTPASSVTTVVVPSRPVALAKPLQPTRTEMQIEKAQRAEKIRAQNHLAQEARKTARVAQKEAAKKAAQEVVNIRLAEQAARKKTAPKPVTTATPRGACSGKANFALVYCMQNQCGRPAFSRHPQCVAFRIDGEVR
jgi:serine/threonine protein kinase